MTENAGNLEETILPEVAEVKSKEVSLLGGIVPKDFSELTRFASLVHQSKLAPKGFDTVEKVAIGLLTNMELGRPVITGLQDLAIINGRCGIYGDASLAMVTASGLMDEGYPKSTETGTPYTDEWTFKFTVKRIGRPEETGVWTWIDSKKAGFDDPKTKDGRKDIWSPWTRFTRRMMQWKARNFVMRDNFGDVLKGMKTVEDLHDLDPIPLRQQTNGIYSTEASEVSETSDLSDAIKDKVDQKEKDSEPLDTSEFERLASELIEHPSTEEGKALDRFLELTAKAQSISVDQLKVEAAQDFKNFWAAFENLLKKEDVEDDSELKNWPCDFCDFISRARTDRGLKKHMTQQHGDKEKTKETSVENKDEAITERKSILEKIREDHSADHIARAKAALHIPKMALDGLSLDLLLVVQEKCQSLKGEDLA